MKLVHEETGLPVKVGDKVTSFRGEEATILDFEKPHKPSSSGKIHTTIGLHYVGVYDLVWIDREDRL